MSATDSARLRKRTGSHLGKRTSSEYRQTVQRASDRSNRRSLVRPRCYMLSAQSFTLYECMTTYIPWQVRPGSLTSMDCDMGDPSRGGTARSGSGACTHRERTDSARARVGEQARRHHPAPTREPVAIAGPPPARDHVVQRGVTDAQAFASAVPLRARSLVSGQVQHTSSLGDDGMPHFKVPSDDEDELLNSFIQASGVAPELTSMRNMRTAIQQDQHGTGSFHARSGGAAVIGSSAEARSTSATSAWPPAHASAAYNWQRSLPGPSSYTPFDAPGTLSALSL